MRIPVFATKAAGGVGRVQTRSVDARIVGNAER